uniref:Putative conserved secreted protein n=1 Tax=Culex tarsalis TaxID=7177 RepID=A0A1Q3FN81_CULTA
MSRVSVLVVLALAALLATLEATPMIYKKVAGQKYEPDWVAVSSTVIPLTEYRVGVGAGSSKSLAAGLPEDEYRRAYLLHKKLVASASKAKEGGGAETAARVQQDPDTLITANKKKAH